MSRSCTVGHFLLLFQHERPTHCNRVRSVCMSLCLEVLEVSKYFGALSTCVLSEFKVAEMLAH